MYDNIEINMSLHSSASIRILINPWLQNTYTILTTDVLSYLSNKIFKAYFHMEYEAHLRSGQIFSPIQLQMVLDKLM